MKKVVDILDNQLGCRVNRTTGTHVHIGASELTDSQFEVLFDLYKANETLIDSFMPSSRRRNNNTYCHSLKDYTYRSWKAGTRYVKLNFQSFAKYGTIEFRHHSGTLNRDKLENWITFVNSLVEYATTQGAVRWATLEEMCDALKVNTSWFTERAEDLEGAC